MSVVTSLMSRSILLSIGMVASLSASAELTLGADLGYSMPSASEFQNSLYASASLGYQSGPWGARAGFTRLGEFELEEGAEDTHLNAEGPFLMLSRTVKSQWVDWEFGFGAARLESVATLQGYELQSESNWEPLAELALLKSLNQSWTLKVGYTYYHDVVGSDVSAASIGLRRFF